MADNPYHEWLGLDPKIRNPHHFQLLGVSSKVENPEVYRQQVLAAAQAKLEMLDRVQSEKHQQLVQKLKQRVETARDVLCDHQKRAEYVKQLKAQIAAAKSAKATGATQNKAGEQKPRGLKEATAQSAPKQQADGQSAAPVPAENPPQVSEQTESPAPAIPMAIPLNLPSQSASSADAPVVGAPFGVAESGLQDNADPDEVDFSKLKFRKVRRRKRSMAIPVLLTVMSLVAIAAAYLIYTSSDKLQVIVQTAPVDEDTTPEVDIDPANPVTGKPEKKETAEDKSTETVQESRDLITVDMDSLPTLDVNEVMEHTETLSATNRNLKGQRKRAERNKQRLANAGEEELETASTDNIPESRKAPDMADGDSNKPMKELGSNQLAEYHSRMQRLRQSLLRRDSETAEQELKALDNLFDGLLGNEYTIAPQQRELKDLLDATNQSKELLDGFWAQTIKSCQGIPGGQEIRVGQQILGFIEADEKQVILRNAGANVTYEYENMPPGLAVVLANQGAIEDIPTWRMQQAAFYSLYAAQNPKYVDQVEQLVDLAESDGHDGSGVRVFMRPVSENDRPPDGKIELPNPEKLAEEIADFRIEHKYSEPAKLNPNRAEELAKILMSAQPDKIEQRIAYLVEAQKLAIRGRNAYLLEDAVLGLDFWSNFEKDEMLTNAFLDLAKQKLDMAQSRRLMETAIPFLKSANANTPRPQKVKQLKKRLTKIAEENEFIDSQRRLNQMN